MKNIFFNADNRIRSAWWIPVFLSLLVLVLFPAILIAQYRSAGVPVYVQAMLVMLVSIICQLLRKEPIAAVTGKLNMRWLRQMAAGLMIGAALMLLPALILTVSGLVHWQITGFNFSTVLSGFAVFITVALVEELLFRGFIFQRLIESTGQWPAQLVIAGLFLLTHINNPGMTGSIKLLASINIFVASVLFGLAFIKTKSLAMPIGIHFMDNWVQGSILGFGVSGNDEVGILKPQMVQVPEWLTGGNFGLEASLFGLLVLLFITVLFYIWYPSKKPKNKSKKMLQSFLS